MKLQKIAVLAVAVGAFALLLRYQRGLERDFIGASQYGASWDQLPQDLPTKKILYV